MEWKKFEIFIDKIKKGIVNVNTKTLKKVIAYSISGIITATTLTGCSFSISKETKQEQEVEIQYNNIDEEIEIKEAFIDEVYNKLEQNGALQSKKWIEDRAYESYLRILKAKESLEPGTTRYDERKIFYPEIKEEDLKKEIATNLSNIIYIMKDAFKMSDYYEFVKDYQNYIIGRERYHKEK